MFHNIINLKILEKYYIFFRLKKYNLNFDIPLA